MKKEQDNNLIDYNKIYNEIYHKVMKQLNEKQNNQNLNAILDTELKKEKKEVQNINQKCNYCTFNDINIRLYPKDENDYFLMKITGKTKLAKLYSSKTNFKQDFFEFVTSDGVLYVTDEKGICYNMTDVCVVRKLEHFPHIDLTVNTKYGDIFITKYGHKLKYVYKLSPLNNEEFIYLFTDDNKVYNYNRYGEAEVYSMGNGNQLYVKYEEEQEEEEIGELGEQEEENNNNNNNNLLDIAPDLIRQSNGNSKQVIQTLVEQEEEEELGEQEGENPPLDNKQNVDSTHNYNNSETDSVKQTLEIGTLYINKENYSIICIKNTQQSLMFNSIQCLVDMYSLDEDYHYKLYKNEYVMFDSTTLSKEDTTNNIEGYIQITQEQFNNIIKNNKITKNNIKIIKRNFINLLNNTISYNKLYPNI